MDKPKGTERVLLVQSDSHIEIQLKCPHRQEWCRIQHCVELGSVAVITNGTLTIMYPCTRALTAGDRHG